MNTTTETNALRYTLPDFIFRERRRLGLSQVALAKKAGVCRDSVFKIENRQGLATLETAERLYNALGYELVVREAGR